MTYPARAAGREAGHIRGSSGYRRMLVALGAAGVATFASLYAPQGVLPLISRDLGVDPAGAALTITAATTALALAVLPWSWVADRLGRLTALRLSICSATVFGLVVPFAPTFEVLLGLRVLEGAALAGLPALAITYLHDEVHEAHSAVAVGAYISGTTVGGAFGRLLAGPLGGAFGWRAGLLAVSSTCAVAAAVFVLAAPRPRRPRPGAPVPVATVWAGVRESLADPALRVLYLLGFVLMGCFVVVYNYLAFRLEDAPFGLSPAVGSLIFTAYLAGTVSSRVAGTLVVRLGRLWVLTGGMALMVTGTVLTLVGWLPGVLIGLVALTAGFFAAHATTSGWVGHRAVQARAQATSLYNLFLYVGSGLLGWLGGILFVASGWTGAALAVAGAVTAAGVLVVLARPATEVR